MDAERSCGRASGVRRGYQSPARGRKWATPIHSCLANGRPEAAEHLAKCGARLNLEAAAGVGHLGGVRNYELVELLTASGAVIDPAWLSERDRGIPLDKMTASEQRMAKALRFGGT